MVKIVNVSKSYGKQVLFENLTFNVNSREKIGLVGRNGFGKSTIFQMIIGNIEPDSGDILIPKYYKIGYLEQHIKFTQPTVLHEGCLGLPENEQHDEWKVKKILTGLGFTEDDMYKDPSTFSGGYQIRLNLTKVLVSKPDLLLLDEPNNYLDIVAIRWLEGFLKSWDGEIMLITHDRSFMDSISTHTLMIHRQKARKIEGDTAKLYNQIALEEEIHEKTRLNEQKKRDQTELFIRRFKAKASFGSLVQSRIKTLEKQVKLEKLEDVPTLEFSFNSAMFQAASMMSLKNINFSYGKEDPELISNFSIHIGKQDRICIIGKNGKGKSTLMRIMAGVLHPASGNITTHPSLKIGYYAQTNVAELNENKMVYEEIMSANPKCLPEQARTISGTLMFSGDMALKKISVLSGGEKSRVLLGKILVQESHLLLLDEPTNHLDMESCESLLDAVNEFEGSVVMVTHNEMYLHTIATRLIIFDRDKIILFEGTYQDFLDNIGWENDDKTSKANLKSAKKNRPVDAKAEKRLKAEVLQEKSRVLKPLEAEIKKLENDIMTLEAEKIKNTELLAKASADCNVPLLTELSQRNSLVGTQIESLFSKLEFVSNKYAMESRKFKP